MRHACLLPFLSLAACATTAPPVVVDPAVANPPVEPAVTEVADTCRNDALAAFTGQPATQALATKMLAASGARTLRWVPRGMMVTMDYRGDRITVALDEANRVERARCG